MTLIIALVLFMVGVTAKAAGLTDAPMVYVTAPLWGWAIAAAVVTIEIAFWRTFRKSTGRGE